MWSKTPMDREWRDTEHNCHYYFNIDNGLIVGQVHNIAHTKIWVANALVLNEEKFLGRYINVDFAKKSVEHYWAVEERTLIE